MAHYKPAGPRAILNFSLANLDSEELGTLEQTSISSHLLIAMAKEFVAEFAQTIPLPPYPRLAATTTQTRWHPPTQGMVKINCDGVTFKDKKKVKHWCGDSR